jgi:hypothetical protein
MTRLFTLMALISMLFTATMASSGIDLGAPNCHTHAAEHHLHPIEAHSNAPQLKVACRCSCPCCTYVAHLIPLYSTPVFALSPVPETLYTNPQVAWVSLAVPPPNPPPQA